MRWTAFLESLWPGWPHAFGRASSAATCATEWSASLLFWGLNILIVYRGMELLRSVENLGRPVRAGDDRAPPRLDAAAREPRRGTGFGSSFRSRASSPTACDLLAGRSSPSVTAMVGFWATLSLNMPDFTRFGRSQREQTVGQVVALPTTMTLFAAMGVFITSAARRGLRRGHLGPDRPGRELEIALGSWPSPSSPRWSRRSP